VLYFETVFQGGPMLRREHRNILIYNIAVILYEIVICKIIIVYRCRGLSSRVSLVSCRRTSQLVRHSLYKNTVHLLFTKNL